MKRFLSILFVASVLLGCSSPTDKAKPLIKEFLMESISNPETYKPGKIEIVDQGKIDVQSTMNWRNIPKEGEIDVVILRHEFKNKDITNTVTDNAFLFYMNPDMDVLYYAHRDKGIVFFPLD